MHINLYILEFVLVMMHLYCRMSHGCSLFLIRMYREKRTKHHISFYSQNGTRPAAYVLLPMQN